MEADTVTDMKISRPAGLVPDHYEYQQACQDALRPAFEKFHQRAVRAGWEVRAVNYALMILAASAIKEQNDRR